MTFPEDKHNYAKAITDFPKFTIAGVELAKKIEVTGDFRSGAICGMGASSMAAELISTVASGSKPILGVRQYFLPREATKETIVIASSYSGNTEETLACYGHAREEGMTIVGASRGGELKEKCQKDGVPFVEYPEMWEGFQPRWAFGLSFGALTTVLGKAKVIDDLSDKIIAAANNIDPGTFREQGKTVADQVYGMEPAIYGPQTLPYLARIWQIDINEDAKVPASWNYFPEVNHYELTGYTQETGNRIAVMLKDPEDNPRIHERMEKTAAILSDKNVKTVFVELPQGDDLTRIFGSTIIGMWAAYHLAQLHQVDPAPTEMVEKFKKMLS